MTLSDLGQKLKSVGEAKEKVEFFSTDGSKLANSSYLKNVLEMPNFRMNIDHAIQYHCHSPKAFSEGMSVQTPSEHSLYLRLQQFNLKDLKARPLAKMANSIIKDLEQAPVDKIWTKEEIAMLIRNALAMRSLTVNTERDHLLGELELIDEALAPFTKEVVRCKEEANVSSSRVAAGFAYIITAQFLASQYGTWVAFSWDIIEPITACVALSDGIAAYLFWMWAGKPWDMNEVRSFFFQRRLQKILKKKHINY